MTRSLFKSCTALATSVALLMPTLPLRAQDMLPGTDLLVLGEDEIKAEVARCRAALSEGRIALDGSDGRNGKKAMLCRFYFEERFDSGLEPDLQARGFLLANGNLTATADAEANANANANANTQQQAQGDQQSNADMSAEDRRAAQEAELAERRAARREAQQAELAQRRAERQAQRELERQQQAQNAAAAGGDEQAAEVVEQTIEQDDVRRAGEEFDTSATQTTAAPREEKLSEGARIALFALGALAVGKLLDNGDKVVSNSGDRVVVENEDGYRVLRDDDVLLRQPGSEVRTERFTDGSTRSTVRRDDGSQVVTVRAADGRVLKRSTILANGQQVVLFDDTAAVQPVQVETLPQQGSGVTYSDLYSEGDMRRALQQTGSAGLTGRSFSLSQVRNIDAVRRMVPEIAVGRVQFATGSAAIGAETAQTLSVLGAAIREQVRHNPDEVFLIEGHTDAVGRADYNLALSDRRAETVALALAEYFAVPPENLVIQGYGEYDLKVPVETAEAQNRRVAVRRITPLLRN